MDAEQGRLIGELYALLRAKLGFGDLSFRADVGPGFAVFRWTVAAKGQKYSIENAISYRELDTVSGLDPEQRGAWVQLLAEWWKNQFRLTISEGENHEV